MSEIVGIEDRLRELGDDHETLLGCAIVDDTEDGYYVQVVRVWRHPTVDGAHILSERTAYLTKGDGNDGWVTDSGATAVNRRVPAGVDPATFANGIARSYAQSKARLDRDADGWEPFVNDLRED